MSIDNTYKLIRIRDFTGRFVYGFQLLIDKDLQEHWFDDNKQTLLVCQHCKNIMELPIYFCKKSLKLFCNECKKFDVCKYQSYEDEHEHERIIKISVGENIEDNPDETINDSHKNI